MIDSKSDSFICHKCVHRCHKQKNERDSPEKMTASMTKGADSQSVTVNSPPSVNLSLPRTSLGHSYCFVCKKPGPKLVIPSVRTRFLAYTKSDIFIPTGARCCPGHIHNNSLTPHALNQLKSVKNQTNLNRSGILELLN